MVELGDVNANMFGFTEVTLDQLPYKIVGWAQATCPYDSTYAYRKLLEASGLSKYYEIVACEDGPVGSHGGCSSCAMCEIVLELKQEYRDVGGIEQPGAGGQDVEQSGEPDYITIAVVGTVLMCGVAALLIMSRKK